MVFVVVVLGLPGVLMALGDPSLGDLGKLAMILSPGAAGLALNPGLGDRGARADWGWVLLSAAVTLAVVGGALLVAFAFGGARLEDGGLAPSALVGSMGIGVLTSFLEELGWAGGGLSLAVGALGRRAGVAVLGLVWAAWHLIPVFLKVGLFPELEAAPPAMIGAFIVACVIYRELLTRLRERAHTWLAAAVGHAAPNILLAGLMGAGVSIFEPSWRWVFFPAPGGLVFPVLALAAIRVVSAQSKKLQGIPKA
jgi:hypothetical protein